MVVVRWVLYALYTERGLLCPPGVGVCATLFLYVIGIYT